MVRGSFAAVQDAVDVLYSLIHHIPTGPDTSPLDRDTLSKAIHNLHVATDNYPKRSKKRKEGDEEGRRADWLDKQGVELWNHVLSAGRLMEEPQQPDLVLLANLKYAAFKLIDTATDGEAVGPYLARVLSIASKTTASLIAAGDAAKWQELVVVAAELEKRLVNGPTATDPFEIQEKLAALSIYYLTRCDAAMADDNEGLAFSMAQRAIAVDPQGVLGPEHIKAIAIKHWEIGTLLCQNPDQLKEACLWLHAGLETLDSAEGMDQVLGVPELKIALLRSAARAELSQGTLDRQDLERVDIVLTKLTSLANSLDPKSVQEIKVLQLHILQQQGAKEAHVRSGEGTVKMNLTVALSSVIEGVSWTDEDVTELLAEIGGLTSHTDMQTFGRQQLLIHALATPQGNSFVPRILLGILLAVRKQDLDYQTTLRVVTQAFDRITSAEVEMDDPTAVIACQTVIWSFGEKAYRGGGHSQAAEWYTLGAHKALSPAGRDNFAKCRRKAALSHIHAGAFASAQHELDQCPSNEATTQYLSFLVAVHEGREVAAISALEAILNCPDLDGKQLLLMAQVAYDKALHGALTSSLSALLTAISRPEVATAVQVHGLTLVRCLMKMTLSEIGHEKENEGLVHTFIYYLENANSLIDELLKHGEAQEHLKAIAWIYKTAYNVGVEQATSWSPSLLSNIFNLVVQIMDHYVASSPLDCDPNLPLQRATAMFACFCGKLFVYRDMEDGTDKADLLMALIAYTPDLLASIKALKPTGPNGAKREHMLRTATVLETELMCEQGDWNGLSKSVEAVLKDSNNPKGSSRALQAVVSVLAQYPSCPTGLTCRVLECALEKISPQDFNDVVHVARWTRSLVTIVLNRDGEGDNAKALHFITKAHKVMVSDACLKAYPSDEGEWLLATAWQMGMTKFGASDVAQGRQWCELALALCSTIPAAANHGKMMADSYQKLLQRYASTGSK